MLGGYVWQADLGVGTSGVGAIVTEYGESGVCTHGRSVC